jgi:1-deoxyxylulose-5-phosphate synthase
MNHEQPTRRQFLGQAVLAAGAVALTSATAHAAAPAAPAAAVAAAAKRTAQDIVTLGNTGVKLSRLVVGLGSNNGQIQQMGGQAGFNRFIKHSFDQGITAFDIAANYTTYNMMGPAIKDLPRDKIFIQSKIEQPTNIMDKIDDHRKKFGTDYVDTMLVHIQYRENWLDTWKRALDDYNAAIDKKWIKARGVSCHSLPALRKAVDDPWTQVHLVRVNPQGVRIDSEQQISDTMRGTYDVKPVVDLIKKMGEKKRGVMGMKIFGGGARVSLEDRTRSLKFAMEIKEIDAVTIGFGSTAQLDEGIRLMNKVLAEMA